MSNKISPLVSIKCLVYNHGPYLRQCLDGFIMQKTNFDFEVIVHDDASTDNSADIIREYADKYPDIIKPIYETENQYSKKDGSLTKIMNAAIHPNAKYIASCEGDDYWIDSNKLQKQVDFLEYNQEYVMCSHKYYSYSQNKGEMLSIIRPVNVEDSCSYSLMDLINGKWLFHPLTVMYRRSAFNITEYLKYKMSYDVILFYHILKSGKGYLFNDIMATYRIHDGGVWSRLKQEDQFELELKQRYAIFEVERTEEAVDFIVYIIFNRPFSRKWAIKKMSFIIRLLNIIYKFKGIKYVVNVIRKLYIHL